MNERRVSKKRLSEIAERISNRDNAVLQSLYQCRYLLTGQLRRLHFRETASHTAALRAAGRALSKLKEYGLVATLERRIGGIRAGSGSFVWYLTQAGTRLLSFGHPDARPLSRRRLEPSPQFLYHILAVAETYVQFAELTGVELVSVETEPDCWRTFAGVGGAARTLKPDLYAVTAAGEYEDHWFFELDMGTESVPRVLRKCRQYLDYYRSGKHQRHTGVFPFVVWIVPNMVRQTALRQRMEEELHDQPDIFTVITRDQFNCLIIREFSTTKQTKGV